MTTSMSQLRLLVRTGVLVAALTLGPMAAWAQSEAERSIARSLGVHSDLASVVWLPDPAGGPEAIGASYFFVENSVDNAWGLFRAEGGAYALVGRVEGLGGESPRDVAFLPERIEITTTALGPDDMRCCPSVPARWSIDRATLTATRIDQPEDPAWWRGAGEARLCANVLIQEVGPERPGRLTERGGLPPCAPILITARWVVPFCTLPRG